MKKIAKQLTELIGNTPLLELSNYEKENDLKSFISEVKNLFLLQQKALFLTFSSKLVQ